MAQKAILDNKSLEPINFEDIEEKINNLEGKINTIYNLLNNKIKILWTGWVRFNNLHIGITINELDNYDAIILVYTDYSHYQLNQSSDLAYCVAETNGAMYAGMGTHTALLIKSLHYNRKVNASSFFGNPVSTYYNTCYWIWYNNTITVTSYAGDSGYGNLYAVIGINF